MQIRTAHLVTALVLGLIPLPGTVADTDSTIQERDTAAPGRVRPIASSPLTSAERHLVDWATGRFEQVGLELPDVEVSFYDEYESCKWNEGLYRFDGAVHRIQVCVADRGTFASDLHRRRTLIHELAHAWEQANLTDHEREALLAVLDADAWFADDLRWEDRGSERFAETIVWGLYDQVRRPTLIDTPCAELHTDFRAITGYAPLGPIEVACAIENSTKFTRRPLEP